MTHQELGKKMVEESELLYFLEAYECVTGQPLSEPIRHESPDFIIMRPDGKNIGIELTQVRRDPEKRLFDEAFYHRNEQDPHDALAEVFYLIETKEAKRAKFYKDLSSILVLQLMDCPLTILSPIIDDTIQHDFWRNRFIEIWLADYTGIDAYGDIELFGLKPLRWWGHHERPNPGRKPYG
jgi:hypothetical protein